MSFTAIIALIKSAIEAIPLIQKELNLLRISIENAKNARIEQEKAEILKRLNTLSSRLRTVEDENEMASIVRNINRLGN